MQRRLEEAEDRYQPILAVGLLQWSDPTSTAARGLLTHVPAASFDRFRVELDMLELQLRSRLNDNTIGERSEARMARQKSIFILRPSTSEVSAPPKIGVVTCRSGVM